MSKQVRKPRHSLIPYATIRAASQGDADAINTDLQHYEGYIARLSLRPMRNSYGCTRLCVDEFMRRRLEIKLIAGILSFQAV